MKRQSGGKECTKVKSLSAVGFVGNMSKAMGSGSDIREAVVGESLMRC